MKQLLFIVLLLSATQAGYAQVFSWGARLGAASTKIDADPITFYQGQGNLDSVIVSATNASYGIHGGLYVRLKFGPVFVQPELLFNTSSQNYTKDDLKIETAKEVLTDRFSTLDLPVMVGVKLGPLRLQGGPVGSVLINNDNELETLSETYERQLQNLSFGYQAGIGVDVSSVLIDLKYEGGLSTFGDTYELYGRSYNLDNRPNRWVLTIGVKF